VVHRQQQKRDPEREKPGGEFEERPRLRDTGNCQRAACGESPRNTDAKRTGHAARPMVPEHRRGHHTRHQADDHPTENRHVALP
jgi:hypothetical protein